jgi:mRNA interferase HigB
MRVISNKRLVDFAALHPKAAGPLKAWRKVVESSRFDHFAALKATFNAVDRVGAYFVFDIGGNRFRLIAAIHFDRQMLFVRHVLTHAQYDLWSPS